ncbi:MAG: hypothetical protein QF811_01070 [Candidatus Woesearchaeota archaeon]|nr:hypothetical protein [Candidatus Woesearchaeota archaeon]
MISSPSEPRLAKKDLEIAVDGFVNKPPSIDMVYDGLKTAPEQICKVNSWLNERGAIYFKPIGAVTCGGFGLAKAIKHTNQIELCAPSLELHDLCRELELKEGEPFLEFTDSLHAVQKIVDAYKNCRYLPATVQAGLRIPLYEGCAWEIRNIFFMGEGLQWLGSYVKVGDDEHFATVEQGGHRELPQKVLDATMGGIAQWYEVEQLAIAASCANPVYSLLRERCDRDIHTRLFSIDLAPDEDVPSLVEVQYGPSYEGAVDAFNHFDAEALDRTRDAFQWVAERDPTRFELR